MGRELEEHGVLWFEEPVIPEDRLGYRKVRDALAIPIAGGECEYTRYGFRDLLVGQCVDIAQPDLCVCGGFSEWLKIQALASSFGVMTIPHVWGSGVALAAALPAGKCPLLVGPGKLAKSDHIRRKKAASFRVSAMAVPSPHSRLARLLIGLYRLWVQHLVQHLLGVAKIISAPNSRPPTNPKHIHRNDGP